MYNTITIHWRAGRPNISSPEGDKPMLINYKIVLVDLFLAVIACAALMAYLQASPLPLAA